MKVYLVWYDSTDGMRGLWNIYASEELAQAAKELIENEHYGTNVDIFPEEAMTSV